MEGEYGINDVCLSIPTLLGRDGIVSTLTPTLTSEEVELLKVSGNAMQDVIKQVF